MRLAHILAVSVTSLLACGSLAFAETEVSTTSTTNDGTISEFSPNTIVVRSQTSPNPVSYTYSKTTTYVDDAGAPVSMEIVKSGLPVTVHYIKDGDRMIANRVIVHKRTTTTEAPAAVEEHVRSTTVTPVAPVQEEHTHTTTTTTVPAR